MKTTQHPSRRVRAIAACALVLPALAGCQLFNEQTTADPGPTYPAQIERGPVFDIQVFRDVETLTFTNTTPVSFGPSVVWLNKRYSQPITGLASGETIQMDLRLFVDQWGETFRAGGFFAHRDPSAVVLVELETADEDQRTLYGLVIVENTYN